MPRALLSALLLIAGCGQSVAQPPLPRRPDPFPPQAFQCRVDERIRQICSELADARLGTAAGSIPLQLKECSLGLRGGEVRWETLQHPPRQLRTLMAFDPETLAERLIPKKVQLFQSRWPCEDCAPLESLELDVSMAPTCLRRGVAGDNPAAPLQFPILTTAATNCPSGWFIYGSDRWCERNLALDTQRYDLTITTAFFAFSKARFVVNPASVEVRLKRMRPSPQKWRIKRIRDRERVDAVRRQLELIWDIPTELPDEHCRDGAPVVVMAHRPPSWRVVRRSCEDPAGVLKLLRTLFPAPATQHEGPNKQGEVSPDK